MKIGSIYILVGAALAALFATKAAPTISHSVQVYSYRS